MNKKTILTKHTKTSKKENAYSQTETTERSLSSFITVSRDKVTYIFGQTVDCTICSVDLCSQSVRL